MAKTKTQNPPAESTRQRWNKIAKQWLEGKTIERVEYISSAEARDSGWGGCGLRLTLHDGTEVHVCQDDEGNGPGALHVYSKTGEHEILCVIDNQD